MRMLLVTLLMLAPAMADKKAAPRTIDLAICLDTSGSMQGLIDSARSKIWAIVNDLALAKPAPRLRVALLSYGNDGHDANAGWVQVHAKFTEDLDQISQTLFKFGTNGGTELVGRVLQTSLKELDWQPGLDSLKLIVVAGNESADQDKQVNYRDVCRKAIARGIMINAIYCTRPGENVAHTWREIARLTDGHYAAIDQNRGTVDLASPFDTQLAALSTDINKTYVAFGKNAQEGVEKQKRADRDARDFSGGTAALRARSKSSVLYFNTWCLVDCVKRGSVKLEEVAEADLPNELRGKSLAEKRKYLDDKRTERAAIKKQINDLHTKRRVWVAGELSKLGQKDDKSFDAAVRKALRAQATAKGYKFEEE